MIFVFIPIIAAIIVIVFVMLSNKKTDTPQPKPNIDNVLSSFGQYKSKKVYYQLNPGDTMTIDTKNKLIDVLVSEDNAYALTCNGIVIDLNTKMVKYQIQPDIQKDYTLTYQTDNNLVMVDSKQNVIWSTGKLERKPIIKLNTNGYIVA